MHTHTHARIHKHTHTCTHAHTHPHTGSIAGQESAIAVEGSRDPPPLMAASQLTNAGAGADGRPSTALAALLEEDSYCTDAGVCMCWGGGG